MGYLTMRDLRGLSGLGQDDPTCGARPGLGPGERAQCCPEVGWVIYSGLESSYGLCERAKARLAAGDDGTSEPADPLQRVQQYKQEIEARRTAFEEQQHQQQVAQMQLQFALARMNAAQQQIAMSKQAEIDAENRRLKAISDERARQETNKALGVGAAVLVALKVLSLAL